MRSRLFLATTLALALATVAAPRGQSPSAPISPRPELSRPAQVVEAVVVGTHAWEVRLARAAGLGNDSCWAAPGVSDDELSALVAHQAGLFASNRFALRDWMAGRDHLRFDPAKDLGPLLAARLPLDPGLPVNVFTARVGAGSRASAADVRGVASLYQLILEVERDGDVLQDAFAFLSGVGLPIYAGPLGLAGDDAAHAALGATLAADTCKAPFAVDANAWRDAGRKVWNWGEKHLGIRDAAVVAREMATEPRVQAAVARLRGTRAARVAVVGHSFTMGNHWASPGSFTTIAAEILRQAGVPVETRHFSGGGLTASRAWRTFGPEVLAWRPGVALLVVAVRNEDDVTALAQLTRSLAEAGTRVIMFDEVRDPSERDERMRVRRIETARAAGAQIVPIAADLDRSPQQPEFLSLDGIHMKEPYHRLMAVAWLEALADTLH